MINLYHNDLATTKTTVFRLHERYDEEINFTVTENITEETNDKSPV